MSPNYSEIIVKMVSALQSSKDDKYVPFIEDLLSSGWTYLSHGRHRNVFQKKDVVIKIPWGYMGAEANRYEHNLYHKHFSQQDKLTGAYYAPCRLLKNGCLMMHKVTVIGTGDHDRDRAKSLPSWSYWLTDGAQVGKDKSGKFVAYDYSDEADEVSPEYFNNLARRI